MVVGVKGNSSLDRDIPKIAQNTKETNETNKKMFQAILQMNPGAPSAKVYLEQSTKPRAELKPVEWGIDLVAFGISFFNQGVGGAIALLNKFGWDASALQKKENDDIYKNAKGDFSDFYKGKNYSLLEMEKEQESLKREIEAFYEKMQSVFTERLLRPYYAKKGVALPPESEAFIEMRGKSNRDLEIEYFKLRGKYDAATESYLEKEKKDKGREPQTQNPQPLQTKVTKDTKTLSSALQQPKSAIEPVDSSGHANLAKVLEKEIIPAIEKLQTSQAASSLELENNQANVEAASEAYSGYTNALISTADSMSYLALTEATVAQKQNVTAEILNNALNEAQARVDNLAGNSLVELSNAFAGAVVNGESFGEALKSIGENILYTIIQMQALSWITSLFGFGGGGMEKFGTFTPSDSILNLSSSSPYGAWGSAIGGLLGVFGFAKGGIVSQPTLFGFSKGIGLMGEAGAEAIMPLGRDSRGNLGVRVADNAGSAGGVFAPHVEINVENKGGGDMSEEQARSLGTQVKAIVEMQVAKQMYEYMRNGTLRPSMGRGY